MDDSVLIKNSLHRTSGASGTLLEFVVKSWISAGGVQSGGAEIRDHASMIQRILE